MIGKTMLYSRKFLRRPIRSDSAPAATRATMKTTLAITEATRADVGSTFRTLIAYAGAATAQV